MFSIISVFTASFIPFIIISFLIIIHELGHFLGAYLCGVELDKIVIYPLGGIAKFKMKLNITLVKELFILIMGPLFQYIAYLILNIVLNNYKDVIYNYHMGILIFNLLPIYPLDGGKLINIFLNIIFPYKKSMDISIIISIFSVLFLIIININNIKINIVIIVLFLLYIIIKEYKRIEYLYNKFLLERYLYKYKYRFIKIINNKNKFFRDRNHIIKEDNKYYLEKDYLEKKFKTG